MEATLAVLNDLVAKRLIEKYAIDGISSCVVIQNSPDRRQTPDPAILKPTPNEMQILVLNNRFQNWMTRGTFVRPRWKSVDQHTRIRRTAIKCSPMASVKVTS